jgi:hypothetical protein
MSPERDSEMAAGDVTEAACGHEGCVCAAGDSGFCSGYCEQQEDATEADARCDCGHADCAATA